MPMDLDQFNTNLFLRERETFSGLLCFRNGTLKVTESLLYPIGQVASDSSIDIQIRKEAIRTFRRVLDKNPKNCPAEPISFPMASESMAELAGQILGDADYHFQTAILGVLCKMATYKQREAFSSRWFEVKKVFKAFADIRDGHFQRDCRKFLNIVNQMPGTRVHSYHSSEVFLDKEPLKVNAWVDFNIISASISFSLHDGCRWDTSYTNEINNNDIESYSLEAEGRKLVLELKLKKPFGLGGMKGSLLSIRFGASKKQILHAAQSIFGHDKDQTNPQMFPLPLQNL